MSDLLPLPPPSSFSFPYETPYPIQTELMHLVYQAIEGSKIAIVQSPTGTGKSLSLLCSTLTWLTDNARRTTLSTLTAYKKQLISESDPSEPSWVMEHMFEKKRRELEDRTKELEKRLEEVRKKEKQRRREAARVGGPGFGDGRERKRLKPTNASRLDDDDQDDSSFLPFDSSASSSTDQDGERDNISPAVRALMNQLNPQAPPDPPPSTLTKIYITSRTHSQLSQLLSELLKTSFASHVRAVALGSRKNLCVNEEVRKGGETGLDERCLDLQSAKGEKRCEFLPGKEEGGMTGERGRGFGERVLATVQDIEDLVVLGKEMHVCPYYGTRSVIPQAEIVTLPYNLVLQKSAREALGIDLTGQVLVIDEAHNLIDTILSIHSQTLTLPSLLLAQTQLKTYLLRFKSRLKGTNALYLKQMLLILNGLIDLCTKWGESAQGNSGKAASGEMMLVGEVVKGMGRGLDQVNLLEVVRYLKESRIAVKVSGYSEKLLEDEEAKRPPSKSSRPSTSTRHSSISSMHQLESFLLSLSNADADGRVLISSTPPAAGSSDDKKPTITLKYLLLNPTDHFRDVVEEVRSVVLAGGTMEPVSDFHLQLFPQVESSRFSNFSCGHVIPKENLQTLVLTKGPKGRDLEFKFDNRGDETLLDELGSVISNACNLVPDGIVVFLPSYAFLEKVKTSWEKSGLLGKLALKKKLFYEPQASGSVEAVLRDYSLAMIDASLSSTGSVAPRKSGALLFAVVGAKLSEGINFSDKLARAVIMVGLPFPNLTSPELKERMKYVSDVAVASKMVGGDKAGRELYMNICMKAVNQSIGRAIRHAGDYAVLILVDKRYGQASIRNKLPKWIGEDVKVCSTFGEGVKNIATFFKAKREAGMS
ncbi:helicase C-terminal domain-containing protein [Mrakia frigida]|uniref:DNA helicase n=1 Tax=Mrakia frigida TaxID=29902 RepID=UPI003FCC041E